MITKPEKMRRLPATEISAVKRWPIALGAAVVIVAIGWVAGIPKLLLTLSDTVEERAVVPHGALEKAPSAPVGVMHPASENYGLSVSKVSMPLVLTATMPGRNAQEGRALIGINRSNPQTYQAGALLENGARIAAIYVDHVVLEKNGRSVELYLEGSGRHTDVKGLQDILTAGGPAVTVAPTPPVHEVLTDYIRPSPVFDGELMRGYQVYAGQKAAVFSQLGLQNGDVITAINGVPLNESQLAIDQLKQLTQGVSVTATVERGEELRTLLLDGALIVGDQQNAVAIDVSTKESLQ